MTKWTLLSIIGICLLPAFCLAAPQVQAKLHLCAIVGAHQDLFEGRNLQTAEAYCGNKINLSLFEASRLVNHLSVQVPENSQYDDIFFSLLSLSAQLRTAAVGEQLGLRY